MNMRKPIRRSSNVVAFPQTSAAAQGGAMTEEKKKRVIELFAALKAEHDAEVRRQRRRMPASLRPLDLATRRMHKAANEVLAALDVVRAEAGLPEF